MKIVLKTLISFIIGVILIISGFVTKITLLNELEKSISESYVITSNNYENFDFYMNFDMQLISWNLTNPTDAINGLNPIFDITKPYDYNFELITINPLFSENDNILSFQKKFYYNILNYNSSLDQISTIQISWLSILSSLGLNEFEFKYGTIYIYCKNINNLILLKSNV